ncbi:MAG: Ig-like domain-containing protein [Prevotellaceae bacterium]|jgi:uncharacterized protein (TIGR02145 family)|nr:Ig-like domain-containing protein [Prevotellaceae bacterium]
MKKYLFPFCVLLALGTASAVFTSCGDDKDEPKKENTPVAVTGISLDKTTLALAIGEEYNLTATVTPANATDKTVTWQTSDPTKATVLDGKVIAVAEGTATITAKAGDKTATCVVTVVPDPIAVTGISLDKTTLTLLIGEEYTFTATVLPDNATDKTVTWQTSDANKTTVEDGKVTAIAAGTATITAKAGNKTATCTVVTYDLFHDEGVVINGVRWATRNVGAPDIFAANPQDPGMLYQWGSNVGWSATEPLTATDGNNTWRDLSETGDAWTAAQNPCPDGWRLPTREEITALVDAGSSWTTVNGINGRLFGSGDNTIFLPAAGYRWYLSANPKGNLSGANEYSLYWCDPRFNQMTYNFSLNEYVQYPSYCNSGFGSSLRCVAE